VTMIVKARLDGGRAGVVVESRAGIDAITAYLRLQHGPTKWRRRGNAVLLDFPAAAGLLSLSELEWESTARRWVENRVQLANVAQRVLDEVTVLKRATPTEVRAEFGSWPMLSTLDQHQVLNVAVMTIPSGWGACVFDEQGTGKTLTVIAAFDWLVHMRDVETLIVVAPKSMVPEWVQEFRRFTGDLYRVEQAVGTREEKARALRSRADVVVANYEAAIDLRDDLRLLCQRARVALVVDESFSVKNPDAQRTGAVAELREWCTKAYVLCGTPAPHSARDLVAQFDLVDYGFTFRGVRLDKRPDRAARQVKDAVEARGVYVRNLKRHVLPNLPARMYTETLVDMAPRQARLYGTLAKKLVDDLLTITDEQFDREYTSYFSRRAALLRICSHPRPLVDDYDEVPGKIVALDHLVNLYVGDKGEKIIIWSHFKFSLDVIVERYARYGVAMIDGSVDNVDLRRDAVRRFQDDDETMIFVGNAAAAGAGLNLHRARIGIYESFSNQAAHFMQSLDRIHRRGQEHDVEYLALVCRGTLEEAEYHRLLAKADAQAVLLGDQVDDRPTRQSMLSALLAAPSHPG
jgi:SNF2 family DNA or RNA helicase